MSKIYKDNNLQNPLNKNNTQVANVKYNPFPAIKFIFRTDENTRKNQIFFNILHEKLKVKTINCG